MPPSHLRYWEIQVLRLSDGMKVTHDMMADGMLVISDVLLTCLQVVVRFDNDGLGRHIMDVI